MWLKYIYTQNVWAVYELGNVNELMYQKCLAKLDKPAEFNSSLNKEWVERSQYSW